MTDQTYWVRPHALFDGADLRHDMALRIKGTTIVEMAPASPIQKAQDLPALLCPGLVDLQVNGGGGALFNARPTPETIRAIAAAHRALGTTRIMPTLITDAPEVLARSVETMLACQDMPEIIGFHIEGPHISATRRGTHAARHVRQLDDTTTAHVARLRQAGMAVMITVAPEAARPEQIAALARMGAVVSLGHSDATAEQTRVALDAGATCFTHLFNAMSPMLNRAPGVVGAAINSQAYCGMICDGLHVADEMLALAIRARPVADRNYLVSDAMPTVGGPDEFDLYGKTIRLSDGKLVNAEGSLAGAHTTMFQSMRRLVQVLDLPLQQALRMAITTPKQAIFGPNAAEIDPLIGANLSEILLIENDLSDFRFASDRLGQAAA